MGVLDTAREVVELVQKADNIELYRQVLSLQQDIMKLLEENRSLQDEVRTLREAGRIRDALRFRDNWYYLETARGEEGPYCSLCWDTTGKLVRAYRGEDGYWCGLRH